MLRRIWQRRSKRDQDASGSRQKARRNRRRFLLEVLEDRRQLAGLAAPTAVADFYSVAQDSNLAVNGAQGVLSNDSDSDGDALNATVSVPPTHGVLLLDADGSFSYTPTAGFSGEDAFYYVANDGTEDSAITKVTLTVVTPNLAPVATSDSYATTAGVPLVVVAEDGVLANDTDADNDTLTATFVASPSHGTVTLNPNGSFTYTPDSGFVGVDNFNYLANDGKADSNIVSVEITIGPANSLPLGVADGYSTPINTPLVIAAPGVLNNDTDADSDTLTATLATSTAHGTIELNANGSFTYTPASGYSGSDSFTYVANDGHGNSAATTVSINVVAPNAAPTATNDSYSTPKNTPLTIAAAGVLANDSDPDGNALGAFLLTGPAHGSVVVNEDGSFTYTPTTDYTGADSFTYVASDGSLSSDVTTVSLTVTVPNVAPVGVVDSYAAFSDTTLTINAGIGVLANDTDANGDKLTAVLSIGPSHGTLTLNSNGSFTYVPTAGYVGADSFKYVANDGSAISNLVTVALTVVLSNVAPVGVADTYSVSSGGSLTISNLSGVLANDTDANGDVLSAVEITGPAHGTLTLNPNGSFTYQSTAGYSGVDSFTYQVSDGTLTSATTAVTINVSSNPPVAVADNYTVFENGTLTRNAASGVLANDTDPDGNSLTASVVTQPQHGNVMFQSDGSFTYSPATGYSGPDSFTYVASDGTKTSNEATVSLTVIAVNSPPVATNDTYSLTAGQTLTTTSSSGVLANDTDSDGDTLTATVVNAPSHGTLTLNANGSFTYTPNTGFTGSDSFNYSVSDGTAASNVATANITVNTAAVTNTAPVGVVDTYTVVAGQSLTIAAGSGVLANDTDTDGNTLTASIVTSPANGTLNLNANGSFTYTPNNGFSGTDSFTYRANDGSANSAATTATITVSAAPTSSADTTATAVTISGPTSGFRGQSLTFTLVATGSTSTSEAFAIDWNNDGTVDQTVTGAATGTQVVHAFDGTGSVTFKVSLPTTTISSTQTVSLKTIEKSGSSVTLGGTSGDDVITVDSYRGTGVTIKLNGAVVGQFKNVNTVVVYGGDGNDTITANQWLLARTLFFGGAGNDRLTGGFSDSVLVGGDGNDTLEGRFGDDVLIGGVGQDSLKGGFGANLMLGGSTKYDANDAALLSLVNAWTSPATLSRRIAKVNASSTPLTGSAVTASDAAVDTIVSRYAMDWILASSTDNDSVTTRGRLARVNRLS